MKVVLDTNVFVSSFFGGKPRQVIDLWKSGRNTLCLSDDVLEEYVSVLTSMELDDELLATLLSLFRSQHNIEYSAATPDLTVVENDPEDDKFLELAVALEADIIVSGDQDLLSIEQYMTIPIHSPDEFLRSVSD